MLTYKLYIKIGLSAALKRSLSRHFRHPKKGKPGAALLRNVKVTLFIQQIATKCYGASHICKMLRFAKDAAYIGNPKC